MKECTTVRRANLHRAVDLHDGLEGLSAPFRRTSRICAQRRQKIARLLSARFATDCPLDLPEQRRFKYSNFFSRRPL